MLGHNPIRSSGPLGYQQQGPQMILFPMRSSLEVGVGEKLPKLLTMAKTLHLLIITLLLLPLSSPFPLPRPSFPRRPTHSGRSAGRTRENGRLHAEFSPQYETRFYTQRLDHFSFRDLPTFQQRYLVSVEHWSGAARMSPIFLYCGNEGDIEWFAENTGFVWEIAPLFGAMVVFPEVKRLVLLLGCHVWMSVKCTRGKCWSLVANVLVDWLYFV